MTQSFALTKDLRAELALKLTGMAIEKHGKTIGAAMKKLNDQFWADHCQAVDGILNIDRARWPELIQAGVITATTTSVLIKADQQGEKFCRTSIWSRDKDKGAVIVTKLLRAPAYHGVETFLKRDGYCDNLVLTMKSPTGSVPLLYNMAETKNNTDAFKAAIKIERDLEKVFAAAVDFHKKAVDVLNGCKTSKQLLEIFPEAAKLLPQPAAKKTNQLVPQEMVNNVRNMLAAGVPSL